ncbi:hypothetical protein C5D04_10385 [Rathayibacter sp. AY1D2]|jgi:hypothetical protein|uniref:hypothetical protein n=1 Tax=unclassified Rathayibacter TaxID=2609250 RepID=UPI000CE74F8A|nr:MULTISPECIES: hypothetical protein [unclassified Rathayibacter]PPF32453.1 hypothetical protein C5B93_15465 [Rathayibacter sp. AY1A2]PPI13212.1 hypothetical protein C5D04_10385 [Rathayibacter sp. AY1D2]
MSATQSNDALWFEHAEVEARTAHAFEQHRFEDDQTLDALLEHVADLHGKPIHVDAIDDTDWETLTALWVDFPHEAQILYRSTDTRLYQMHCILHELAHIVLRHPGCNVLGDDSSLASYRGTNGLVRGRLLETGGSEDLENADGDRRILEGEAEHLAHLLSRSLLRPRFREDEEVFG